MCTCAMFTSVETGRLRTRGCQSLRWSDTAQAGFEISGTGRNILVVPQNRPTSKNSGSQKDFPPTSSPPSASIVSIYTKLLGNKSGYQSESDRKSAIPNPPPPSSHPSQESLVTPTRQILSPLLLLVLNSPPSDLPSSTLPLPISTPESAKKRRQLPDVDDVDGSPQKKRKHQRVDTDTRTHHSGNGIRPTPHPPELLRAFVIVTPPTTCSPGSGRTRKEED